MYHVCFVHYSNKEEITLDKLSLARVYIICGPREKFSASEFETFKQYLERGGSLLVMMGEGGEVKYDTNINYLLEQFGVMINNGERGAFLSPYK